MSIQKGNIPKGWELVTEGNIEVGDRKWVSFKKDAYYQILVEVEEADIGRPVQGYNVIRKVGTFEA